MAFFPRIFEHIKKSFVIRFREALTSLVFIGILRELMCCIEAKAARGLLAHVACGDLLGNLLHYFLQARNGTHVFLVMNPRRSIKLNRSF